MKFSFSERLPFSNRPENIARYEDGIVKILDRRNYPFEKNFVTCETYEDVAVAIEKMITQSYGPKYAVAYGMVQAARELKNEKTELIIEGIRKAADRMIITRPTNDTVKIVAERMYAETIKAVKEGVDAEEAALKAANDYIIEDNERMDLLGKNAANLIEDGDTVFTICWADTTIAYTMANVVEQGKKINMIISETRPYLQGARLTSQAMLDLGIPTTVITDNMAAHVMSLGKIDKIFFGADRLTMSGHVFNKVGSLQVAICAHHYGIPVYAYSLGPDIHSLTDKDVINEVRDPEEVLHCRGIRTAAPGVKGFYPSFDATPPEFLSGIVTDTGVHPAFTMKNYWNK